MKSRIIFNGMNRNVAPAIAQPGDSSVTVNLRKRSDHLTPVGPPEMLYTTSEKDHRLLYIHSCYDGEHHITANDSALYYEVLVEKENDKVVSRNQVLFKFDKESILSVQSIGNTLIVICAQKTYYLLYKENDYIFLGEKPEIPEISFSAHPLYTDAYQVPEYTFSEIYTNPDRLLLADANHFSIAYYDAFFQLQENAWKRHYFIQPILVRYAITLYDGSRIFSSAPVMISQPNPIQPYQIRLRVKSTSNICSGTQAGEILAINYNIRYFIRNLNLENWKDIVRSIDIFVAPEATIFEPDAKREGLVYEIERTEELGVLTFYVKGSISFLDLSEIKKQYLQSPLFYKIATIENWSDLKSGKWYDLNNEIRPDQLVHEEALTPDNTTLLSTGAQVSYVHNKRLHMANLSRKLFPGFPLCLYDTGQKGTESADAYIRTYLKNEWGESVVVWSGHMEFFSNQLSPLISYPDSNAYKMEIVVKSSSGRYKGTFTLTPSEHENRADYLGSSFDPLVLPDDSVSASTPLEVPTASNDVYTQNNTLRVSEYENPFLFPAEQTYSVSNSAITGIASITTALSEGQFGEFPLYLFTEEGIWALQNGTGDVCYSAQHQLSREPIPKGSPIIPLEEAVIFATSKGLSILQGASTQQILPFDELPNEDNSLLETFNLSSEIYQAAYDHTLLSDFMANCIIAYNTNEKELLFCQPSLGYTIVLYLPTLYMYRTTQCYTSFLYNTTHLLGQDEQGNVYDLHTESQTGLRQFLLLSRPITLQSECYQRWRELSVKMAISGKTINLALFGGNDAESVFTLVGHLSSTGRIPGKLTMRITGPAYKYYRIFILGNALMEFHLWAADILADIIDNGYRLR